MPRRNAPRSGVSDRASAALRASSRRKTAKPPRGRDDLPDVYQEMLAEVGAGSPHRRPGPSEPPRKRLKRPGQKPEAQKKEYASSDASNSEGEDEDLEFEDVDIPAPIIQTIDLDSDDEDDDEIPFEDVDLGVDAVSPIQGGKSQGLELNFSAHLPPATPKKGASPRKPLSKAERERRIEIHKMHLLCLTAHVAQRNHWCNDEQVQDSLRGLLTDKMLLYLNPGSNLSQFGRTESLKNGLQQVTAKFKTRFRITERGLKRTLWADDVNSLRDYELPSDMESTLDKADFREAAQTLQGSRDVGAQLFCALLRTAGVETRLVCSLQPLSFAPGAPALPKPKGTKTPSKMHRSLIPNIYQPPPPPIAEEGIPSPRRRLGYHTNAVAYNIPSISRPSASPSTSHHQETSKTIRNESPFPIYWVEVFDVAHQKWQPVDPLVTQTQWKPAKLEPPASDRQNNLTYVFAFSSDNSVKDVTRRYARAFNSKTRRVRIDGNPAIPSNLSSAALVSGDRWLRRALRHYRRSAVLRTPSDDIEDAELTATEAREPMPKGVADFKDHPVYALVRHLRRHEVLVPGATTCGTVAPSGSAGKGAALERIYRRNDVRVARSGERWYRLGRVIHPGATPVKYLPKQRRSRNPLHDDDPDDADNEDPVLGGAGPAGTPLFTFEQTDPYLPPPVLAGRVPKNRFGNLDVYVPSMIPPGGAHVEDPRAARAAHVLGVDYAPALTGFAFRGRHGTAVLRGAVVPAEAAAAVCCVVAALGELEADEEAGRRAEAAVRMWSRLLKGLRIRDRLRVAAEERGEEVEGDGDEYGGGGEEVGRRVDKGKGVAVDEDDDDMDMNLDDAPSDVTEEFDMIEPDDDGGGGFLID